MRGRKTEARGEPLEVGLQRELGTHARLAGIAERAPAGGIADQRFERACERGHIVLGVPSQGRILLDGNDIGHLPANELRSYFGVVPQETTLFSGSIYENLLMANRQASLEQIVQTCRMAEIHDVIEKLPNGYMTEIGERGVGLSGGQKQRIAIARALLKRPKILIFDEATSNLDQSTAEQFAKTVNALRGKATMLFITHALPAGLKVDQVFRLGERREPAIALGTI